MQTFANNLNSSRSPNQKIEAWKKVFFLFITFFVYEFIESNYFIGMV